jgi:hypothetical protein
MHFVLAWVIVLFTGVCTADMMGYNSSFRVSSSADLVTAAETRDGHDYSTIQLNITSVQTPYYITSVEKRVRIPLSTSDERMVISAANINDYTVFHPADAAQYTQQTIPFGQYLHFGPLDPTKAIFVGYDIISATDTFSVYLVTQTEYQNLQNQQSFQYYTSFSKIDTQSARFLSAGVPANYFTEQLYLIIIAGVQNLNGITLMMNVRVLNGSPNTCVSGSCPCSVNSCNSQGLCATDATGEVFPLCSCFTGYSGSQCSSYTCDTVVCGNHASCVGFETCSCDSGWIQTSSTNNPLECNHDSANECESYCNSNTPGTCKSYIYDESASPSASLESIDCSPNPIAKFAIARNVMVETLDGTSVQVCLSPDPYNPTASIIKCVIAASSNGHQTQCLLSSSPSTDGIVGGNSTSLYLFVTGCSSGSSSSCSLRYAVELSCADQVIVLPGTDSQDDLLSNIERLSPLELGALGCGAALILGLLILLIMWMRRRQRSSNQSRAAEPGTASNHPIRNESIATDDAIMNVYASRPHMELNNVLAAPVHGGESVSFLQMQPFRSSAASPAAAEFAHSRAPSLRESIGLQQGNANGTGSIRSNNSIVEPPASQNDYRAQNLYEIP